MSEICINITHTPQGNRWAIGDIHGCYKTFIRLLQRIELSPGDHLFLLGDYIDRGKNSKGVIDYIQHLIEQGYQIFPLRGNHEQDLLSYALQEFELLEWHLKKNNMLDMLQGSQLHHKYLEFFNALPFCYQLHDYFIVHAGLDFSRDNPLEDTCSMLWLRTSIVDITKLNGRRILHGHSPTYLEEIQQLVQRQALVISLDSGAVYNKPHKYYDHTRMGHLTAFNLDNFDLIHQKNID